MISDLFTKGIKDALESDKHLKNGLNIMDGMVVHPGVKEALL